jgi:hypothetical protein
VPSFDRPVMTIVSLIEKGLDEPSSPTVIT